MKRLALFLLLLLAPVLSAQDVTCNAGDIAWVTEDENADEGIVGGTNTAEYNNSAAAWGIQAVFDEACAGLDIRIVVGANNYNSSSTSWNNRDAANKQINIDTVAGTETAPIKITGYDSLDGAKALATLDFDKGSISGGEGLAFSATADYYVTEYIRVTDADLDCIDSDGAPALFVRIEADNCDNAGFAGLAGQIVAFSLFHDNVQSGAYSTTGDTIFFKNESYNNTGDGLFFTGIGNGVVGNLVYGNADDGLEVGDYSLVAFNTASGNTDDGASVSSSSEFAVIADNILTGSDTGLSVASGGMVTVAANNNYGDNTTAAKTLGGPAWVDDDSTPDTTTCTFVSATDFEVVTNCTYTFTFPRATTSTEVLKGAVQNAAGGAASTTIITQGVAF